jgi:hypothetical protein
MTCVAIAVAVAVSLGVGGCSRRPESTSVPPTLASSQPLARQEPGDESVGVVNAYLFVATADELSGVFTGWARPFPLLDHFVVRTERNPFTRKEKSVRTRVPDAALRPAPDAVAAPDLKKFDPLGRKGLEPLDVQTVGRALLDWDEDNASSEISGRFFAGPPEAHGVLLEVPPALTARLADLSPNDFPRVATKWAALFRTDAATVQSDTVRQQLLSTPDSVFVTKLSDLASVARKAASSSRTMFLWTLP